MGSLVKLVVDPILFFFLLIIVIGAPLIDSQTVLPPHLYPTFLVDLKAWYSKQCGDYLIAEKPHFFVEMVWLELLFQWPLALASLYGISTSKSWLNTTCLLYGASTFSTIAVIMGEFVGSGRASEKLLMTYCPFMAFAALAILRGLLSKNSPTTPVVTKRPVPNKKKRLKNLAVNDEKLCYQHDGEDVFFPLSRLSRMKNFSKFML